MRLKEKHYSLLLDSGPVISIKVTYLAFLFACLPAFAGQLFDLSWEGWYRDRQIGQPFWNGAISKFGVLLMLGASAVCLRVAVALPDSRTLLIVAAVFAAVFAADDFLGLHEGRFELLFFCGYLLLGILIYVLASQRCEKLFVWPLLVAGAAFGFSIVVDQLWNRFEYLGIPTIPHGHWSVGILLEDASKLAGIITFSLAMTVEAKSMNTRDEPGIAG